MTSSTICAKAPEVRIISVMAGLAILSRSFGEGFGMTGGALKSRVGTGQNEIGLYVVIKTPRPPIAGVVAGLTFGSEAAAVFVVFLMAGNASFSRIVECG